MANERNRLKTEKAERRRVARKGSLGSCHKGRSIDNLVWTPPLYFNNYGRRAGLPVVSQS